jgi:hypothetical protein
MEKSERPLHVLVAEALGWIECRVADYPRPTLVPDTHWPIWHGRPSEGHWPLWMSRAEWEREPNSRPEVPHYELSWEETGPLIDKYAQFVRHDEYGWVVYHGKDGQTIGIGETLLIATCRLVLAMKELGELCAVVSSPQP